MNALADKVHKQGMPHSDTHSITWPHYSTTIPTQVAVARHVGTNLLLLIYVEMELLGLLAIYSIMPIIRPMHAYYQ